MLYPTPNVQNAHHIKLIYLLITIKIFKVSNCFNSLILSNSYLILILKYLSFIVILFLI